MISQDLIASLSANLYDDKTAAAIGAALLDPNNALFSPELLDAVSPFLASNTNYNAMVGDASAVAYGAGNQDDMQFFPAMVEYADQLQYDAEPDVGSEQGSYASASIAQASYHVSGSLKRSGDLYEVDAASSTLSADDQEDHDDESDEEDDEYHEPGRRAHGSNGSDKRKQGHKDSDGQPAAKKPRTRPPNADDILLKTDPALVEKLLVPVRKRRQPKAIDPSLPPEVGFVESGLADSALAMLTFPAHIY